MNQEKGFTISNSNSKCLLENWVEERNSKSFDDGKSHDDLYKQGHSGLLTIRSKDAPELCTTYRCDYTETDANLPQKKYVGRTCKRDFLNQMFTQRAIEQLQREEEAQLRRQYEERMQSETSRAFWKEQNLKCQPNVMDHDLLKEQPITFWTEHAKRVTGTTKVPSGTIDSAFRKNATFSKPISERYDEWACDTK